MLQTKRNKLLEPNSGISVNGIWHATYMSEARLATCVDIQIPTII